MTTDPSLSRLRAGLDRDATAQRFLRGEITWDAMVDEKRGYREIERGRSDDPSSRRLLLASIYTEDAETGDNS